MQSQHFLYFAIHPVGSSYFSGVNNSYINLMKPINALKNAPIITEPICFQKYLDDVSE